MKLTTDRSSEETIHDKLSAFCDAVAGHILSWPDAHTLAWGAVKASPTGRLELLIKPQTMQAQLERQLRADQSSYMVASVAWEHMEDRALGLKIQARAYDGCALTSQYKSARSGADDSGSP